ncbi:MAG TPA: hypothetical protein VFQ51_06685, partial [Vicinamibacteria bacterium]|nr:hypothetical protein [Vicinamibacteria bacterium]
MVKQLQTRVFLARCLTAAALLLAPSTATMAANTYYVDRTVGETGRVTGFIVTNGKTGVLTASDIIDWDVTIDSDGLDFTTARLRGPLSGLDSAVRVEGTALTATAEGLFFDFGSPEWAVLDVSDPRYDRGIWQAYADASGGMHAEVAGEYAYSNSYVEREPTVQLIASGPGPAFVLALGLNRVQVRDEMEDVLRIRANFTLDPGGDGIDPATEPVSLAVSTPDGSFYPSTSVFPILPGEFERVPTTTGSRWQLTAAGRQRTGIERFDIDDSDGSIVFVDRHLTLPARPYARLSIELVIGNDSGRARATLVEEACGNGRWRTGVTQAAASPGAALAASTYT